MKKVKLYYRMLESNNVDAATEEGETVALVTDGIAQRLLEGQKVGKVVCFLIALASLQGWNGGCHLIRAETIEKLTLQELRERVGRPVYDATEGEYRVIEAVYCPDELAAVISFTDGNEIDIEIAPCELYDVDMVDLVGYVP